MARSPRRVRTAESASGRRSSATSGPRHAEAVVRRPLARSVARLLVPVLLVVLTVGVLALGALPTRTWLDQRRTAAAADRRLAELESANAEAEALAEALQSDTEIERMAREQYGYARAGEEVYHLLPEARDPVRVPDAWPFTGLGATIER